jgi:hypothetical protein
MRLIKWLVELFLEDIRMCKISGWFEENPNGSEITDVRFVKTK